MTSPDPQQIDQLNADTQAVVAQLRAGAVIQSDEQYRAAGKLYRQAKDREKVIKEHFAPLKSATNTAHKAVVASEKDALALITGPMATIKSALERYDSEQRRIAREEADRQEALRQAELNRQMEALKAQRPEMSAVEEAMATEVMEEAMLSPVPVVAQGAPKIGGIQFRTVIDREKVQARIDTLGLDHGIKGILVERIYRFTVLSLSDVPDEYKKRQ